MTRCSLDVGATTSSTRLGVFSWLGLAALLAFAALGCAKTETVTTEQKTAYQQSARGRLDAIQAEIDSLSAKAAVESESLKVDLALQLESLRAQRDSAETAIGRLQEATSEAWEDTKAGTDRLLERTERGIAEARSRLHSRADTTGT